MRPPTRNQKFNNYKVGSQIIDSPAIETGKSKKELTLFEFWTLMASILALLISGVSPFLVYRYLDPTVQIAKHKARLYVLSSGIEYLKSNGYSEQNRNILVYNFGDMPASGLKVILSNEGPATNLPILSDPIIEPSAPFTTTIKNNQVWLTIDRQIDPGQEISIAFGQRHTNAQLGAFVIQRHIKTPRIWKDKTGNTVVPGLGLPTRVYCNAGDAEIYQGYVTNPKTNQGYDLADVAVMSLDDQIGVQPWYRGKRYMDLVTHQMIIRP